MNTNLLKYHVAESGYKVRDVAMCLNLSGAGLSLKLSGKNDFTLGEVVKITELLNLNIEDVNQIFFDNQVNYN